MWNVKYIWETDWDNFTKNKNANLKLLSYETPNI